PESAALEDAADGIFDALQGRVTLAGAINETLDFRLHLKSRQGTLRGVRIACSALGGPDANIDPSAVQIFRIENVHLERWPGWHIRATDPHERVPDLPDVLVPLDAQTRLDIPEGTRLAFWVDVNIPKGMPPGSYNGALQIADDSGFSRSIDLQLTVWPLVLPDSVPVALLTEVDHGAVFRFHVPQAASDVAAPLQNWGASPAAAELDAALAATMQLLEAHRVTPILSRLRPVLKVGREAEVSVDWDDYDRVVAGYLNGTRFVDRIPLPVWKLPFDETFPPPPPYGAAQSPTHSRVMRQYLKTCAEHFAARGWLERCVLTLPGALDGGEAARELTRHFGRIARMADPRLVTIADLPPQDLADYGWEGFVPASPSTGVSGDLSALIDVWCPPAQFYDPPIMAAQRQTAGAPKRTWMRVDRPPFSGCLHVAAGPISALVIPWQARSATVGAVQLGAANDWPAVASLLVGGAPASATAQACIEHDPATLIYPGAPYGLTTPIPSVRLKQLRRGMQDLGYLSLLDAASAEYISETVARALCPRVGAEAYHTHYADGVTRAWPTDAAVWSDARRIIVDELLQRTRARAGEPPGAPPTRQEPTAADPRLRPPSDIARNVQWQHFISATRKLSATVEGVRVQRTGTRNQALLRVEITVCINNSTRSALGGQLGFESLPFGWEADPATVDIPPISPGRMLRSVLSAQARALTWDPGGIQIVELALRTDDGRTTRIPARINYMSGATAAAPLKIDGDLSDWPLSPVNVADGFVLVSGTTFADPFSFDAPTARDGTPAQRTQCAVARDANTLYLGVNCWTRDQGSGVRGQGSGQPSGSPPRVSDSLDQTSARNFVQYEDLIPVGEELIEVLIDPSNSGSRSPADLYHLVIKRSGAPAWERGIALDPPVGRRAVWPADIRTQVRVFPDRWCAEVAIPLAAFGELLPGPQIWGINFTRFDLVNQQYSNWAAAVGNVYDPLSLGNLALP
ncbi:MAG TPA: hypothetical protein VGM03_20430, partial [Phycisphaerae bacterium]